MSRYIDADALKEECYKFANDVSRSTMAFVQGQINAAPTANVAPIADTVRKMRDRFSSLLSEEYRKYTPEGADQYFKNGAYMMRAIADRLIILIAKEMLEGSQ